MTDVRLTATNPDDSSVVPVACNEKGELKLEEPLDFNGDLDGDLTVSGRVSIGGEDLATPLYVKGDAATIQIAESSNTQCLEHIINSENNLFYVGTSGPNWNVQTQAVQRLSVTAWGKVGIGTETPTAKLEVAGDLTVNANAGFTSEGYLWCTDRRGKTWVLDSVSNSLGQWVEYAPPSTSDQVQEKLEEWAEKGKDQIST